MTKIVINEGSALFLTFSFTDEAGNAIIPATIDWRVDNTTDKHSIVQVLDWAAIGIPAASVGVQIAGVNNAIVDQLNIMEDREVTVRMNAGLSTQAFKHREYSIKNIRGQS